MTSRTALQFCHHRAAGVSLVVAVVDRPPAWPDEEAVPADPVPTVLHWGADLGPLQDADVAALVEARRDWTPHSALDDPTWLGVLPDQARGFTGTPAIEVLRTEPGEAWAPRLVDWSMETSGSRTVLRGHDGEAGLRSTTTLELTEEGLLLAATEVTNTGPTPLTVQAVRTVLPVGSEAVELLGLDGVPDACLVHERREYENATRIAVGSQAPDRLDLDGRTQMRRVHERADHPRRL